MSPAGFGARLLRWYDAHRRTLPWRDIGNPWATWVSEIMLQQTRVEAVREAFVRFMAAYPTPAAWAAADDEAVLAAWRGLGYYRRARLLREGARAVVAEHGGRVPDDPEALGALPGIGAYTRGAIASIAFGRAVPAIDGNVERVFARWKGIDGMVKAGVGAAAVKAAVLAALAERGPAARPGDFNQAVMDLGATVCTPRSPRCEACPLAADCVARRDGRQAELPVLPDKKAMVDVHTRMALVRLADGRVLGQRVPDGAINAGQVDLPGPGPLMQVPSAASLQAWFDATWGDGALTVGPVVAEARHGITNHRIRVVVHEARWSGGLRGQLVAADLGAPWTTLARKGMARAATAGDA